MDTGEPCVLAINGGSSSIRFAVYRTGDLAHAALAGKVDRIGRRGTTIEVRRAGGKSPESAPFHAPDHHRAVKGLMDWIEGQASVGPVLAVGHRIVHGMNHAQPERVTAGLLMKLRKATAFAPEHLPLEIELMEAFRRRSPRIPQVACFDTSFHRSMPRVAKLLPIPRCYFGRGVERYGFHGLAYQHLMEELRRIGDKAARKGRVILAHLGNGASMAAVLDGRSVDTSMAFTPAAGLVMGTRTGDLDPGVLLYLGRTKGMTPGKLARLVNHESGLLGVSGSSSDMRDLQGREGRDRRAGEAVDLFCHQAAKWIGSLAAVLGGVDTLVFSGGIGENSPAVRSRICAGLGFLGIALDQRRNVTNAPLISRRGARLSVRVIRSDEEGVIARAVVQKLRLAPTGRKKS